MKNQCNFGVGEKRPQNELKSGFGTVLGSIWESFGKGLGSSGLSFGHFWPPFGNCSTLIRRLLNALGPFLDIFWNFGGHFSPSGLDFASILNGFGRFWKDFRIFFYPSGGLRLG